METLWTKKPDRMKLKIQDIYFDLINLLENKGIKVLEGKVMKKKVEGKIYDFLFPKKLTPDLIMGYEIKYDKKELQEYIFSLSLFRKEKRESKKEISSTTEGLYYLLEKHNFKNLPRAYKFKSKIKPKLVKFLKKNDLMNGNIFYTSYWNDFEKTRFLEYLSCRGKDENDNDDFIDILKDYLKPPK